MKAELVPDNGDPPIPIVRDLTVVGRREFADVVIDHASLSKRHCLLVKTDGLLSHWDYLYEPDSVELMDVVLQRYVESQVYQGLIENVACEQSARMVAMKAATDNAGKIINGLQLAYNKARQANITKELSEIVGGAAAV